MTNSNKIQEYIDTLENDKLMIETHFANIERILKDNDDLNQEKKLLYYPTSIHSIYNMISYAMI